jgi:hypothetical protein
MIKIVLPDHPVKEQYPVFNSYLLLSLSFNAKAAREFIRGNGYSSK